MPLGSARFGLLGGADLGNLKLIQSQSFSSVSSVAFESIEESTYDVHLLTLYANRPSASGTGYFGFQLRESGTYETANVYDSAWIFDSVADSGNYVNTTGDNVMQMGTGTSHTCKITGYAYFYNLGDSSVHSGMTFHHMIPETSGTSFSSYGGSLLPQASTVDGIKMTWDVGDNISGYATLYGLGA